MLWNRDSLVLSAPEDLVKPGTNTLVFASRTNAAMQITANDPFWLCHVLKLRECICGNHLEVCGDHSSPLCGNDVRVPAWISVHQHHHVAFVAPIYIYILGLPNYHQSQQNIGPPYNPQAWTYLFANSSWVSSTPKPVQHQHKPIIPPTT